jgi:ribosomal protein S12 methylthiotransferase accessory factor YcaO
MTTDSGSRKPVATMDEQKATALVLRLVDCIEAEDDDLTAALIDRNSDVPMLLAQIVADIIRGAALAGALHEAVAENAAARLETAAAALKD